MKFIDKAITNLEAGNRNIHEKASSPEIRAKKHAKAQAQGSKTDKSKKTMSNFARRALAKKYMEDPEAVRKNERALAAGRRFVRGERYNQPSSVAESFVYAFNMWSFMLAEAGRKLGPIAKRYEGQKTTDITDRRLRAAAKREKARVEKKLGIKTNPDAGQLVQQHQERKRKKKRKVLGLPPETPDIAQADREEDKRKMRGDRR